MHKASYPIHVTLRLDGAQDAGKVAGTGLQATGFGLRVRRRVRFPGACSLKPVAGRGLCPRPWDGAAPGLRNKLTWRALRATFQLAICHGKIRITDFSLQHGHVHLIVEAVSALALTRGMQGFCISFAKRLNKLHGRHGSVFAERYHARELRTPLEVKRCVSYVIHNARRHGVMQGAGKVAGTGLQATGFGLRVRRRVRFPGACSLKPVAGRGLCPRPCGVMWGLLPYDPYSSASWFDGFAELIPGELIEPTGPPPTAAPLTWLRACGFSQFWGPVSVDAMPQGAS